MCLLSGYKDVESYLEKPTILYNERLLDFKAGERDTFIGKRNCPGAFFLSFDFFTKVSNRGERKVNSDLCRKNTNAFISSGHKFLSCESDKIGGKKGVRNSVAGSTSSIKLYK